MLARCLILIALALTPALGADLPAQGATDADALVGCYVLQRGPWTRTIGDEAAYYAPPDTVQLHADQRVTPTLRYSPGSARRARAAWRRAEADSVVLTWTNGYAVARLALSTRGSVLRGEVEAISDARPIPAPPRRIAQVSARRFECRTT